MFRSSHQRFSTATLLKKRLQRRCFPLNFVKFLRTPFLQNTSGRLLLYVLKKFLLCTMSRSRLVQTGHYYLLQYFEVKQIEADEISTCNAIKKRLEHTCFSWKFAIFIRTHFSTEQLRWLLLNKPRRSLWFIVWRSDALVIQHESIFVIQYHVKQLAKSHFTFKLYCGL